MAERGTPDHEPELVVLIVDDDPDIAGMLAEVFEHHGARAICAGSAAEARALLERRPRVDVVVTDYAMPREDGLSFLASLRATARGYDLPVVVISGYDPCGELARAAREHGADFVQKPFALETIVTTVHAARALRLRVRTA